MALLGVGNPIGDYVDSFVSEVEDDLSAPAQSRFQESMQKIKSNVVQIEEVRYSSMLCSHALTTASP